MTRSVQAAWLVGVALVVTGVAPRAQRQDVRTETVNGYAEWRRGSALIVDGERVVAGPSTKIKGKGVSSFDTIPLGFEVKATGVRVPDGAILARTVEAKPNGNAIFENDVKAATSEMEANWLRAGVVTEPVDDQKEEVIGRIIDEGVQPARVRRIVQRVAPPYVDPGGIRVHVVDTKDWNAMAMGNGAIWVFTGLLKDMDDDEVAIVLAHELAHYTHEHSRREYKKAMIGGLAAIGLIAITDAVTDNDTTKTAVAVSSLLVTMLLKNGYSRDLEDQADRVGLRYAYEGGFDVTKGPKLWLRFRDKYGDQNGLVNFVLGDHSRASARVKNLEREIALNYSNGPR